jgi:perosamine synthetase
MIPVNTPLLDGNERRYLNACIESGWVSSEGPYVARFEAAMAAQVGRAQGVAVCNGGAALDIAVAALGLGPGDEVILPTFTIISCAAAVLRSGATPVFVDAEPRTWNMDVTQVEAVITPRSRAIMAVHVYGLPVDMEPLLDLARSHGLAVIEDAAEAHGLLYRGRPCGGFGTLSTFSFYANKLLTTGEGGMVVTDEPDLAERCRRLRNLAFQPGKRFVHEELGWNYRMTNLQAAVGLAQLEQMDRFLAIKRRLGLHYSERLGCVPGLQLPPPHTADAESTFWVFGVVLDDAVPFDGAEAMARLATAGIGTRPFFWPMHEQPVLRRLGLGGDRPRPVAERIARRGFYIPCGVGLGEDDQERVCVAVAELMGQGGATQ